MGWKRLKDEFAIGHIVQVTSEGVCIGSRYAHNLVTIDPTTGAIAVNKVSPTFLEEHYPLLLDASPEERVRLIEEEDSFSASVTVYTYEGAEIIEKVCEEPGWPNVTHDGCIMYQNLYSTDKSTAAARARRNAASAVEVTREFVAKAEKELAELRAQLTQYEADKARLDADYPTPSASHESA